MRVISILLTAIFSIFAAVGFGTVIVGKAPIGVLVIATAYVITAMALCEKGGKVSRYVAYLTGLILSLGIIGCIYALISYLSGSRLELLLIFSGLVMGLIGITTFYSVYSKARNE